MNGQLGLDGLDGRVLIEDVGILFERSKLRASGRGVGTVHRVPWSAVVGASVDRGKTLRVEVAGYDRPRLSTSDPHAVDLKRGQADAGAELVRAIATRAAGQAARPVLEAKVVEGAPSTSRPVQSQEQVALQRLDRVYKWQGRIYGFQLAMLVVALLALGLIGVFVLALVLA